MSRMGLCLEGVMYGGGFVHLRFFVRGGFVRRGFCRAPCMRACVSVCGGGESYCASGFLTDINGVIFQTVSLCNFFVPGKTYFDMEIIMRIKWLCWSVDQMSCGWFAAR